MRDHVLGAQLPDDGGEVLEIVHLEVDQKLGEIRRAAGHADVVYVAIMLGDHRGFLGLVGHYSFDAARIRLKRGVSVAAESSRRELAGVSAR